MAPAGQLHCTPVQADKQQPQVCDNRQHKASQLSADESTERLIMEHSPAGASLGSAGDFRQSGDEAASTSCAEGPSPARTPVCAGAWGGVSRPARRSGVSGKRTPDLGVCRSVP